MENAADAIKMAFAIFVFVIAVTILFVMITRVRSTADTVFYVSDNTNFRAYDLSSGTNRTVGVTEIISTLYRYYKESVAVTIVDGSNSYYFDIGNETIVVKDSEDNVLLELGSEENIEKNLGEFIENTLLYQYDEDDNFIEEFTEVPTSGIYSTGSDGSEIVLSAGGKKVYITYTKQ